MAVVAEPFEYTATGVLGDKRDSMLQNQLLLRVTIKLLIQFIDLPIHRSNFKTQIHTESRSTW